jgi:hypothetical protein
VSRCPSELALEQYLFAPAVGDVSRHLEACAACRSRVAEMRRQGEEFERFVFPRTVDAVEQAARRPRRGVRLLAWLVPAGGLAVAAVAFLLHAPAPDEGYLGVKGSPMALRVWAGGESGAQEIADGGRVPAGAALRFQVTSARPCALWIVSVDASGAVSRIYPAQGDAARVTPPSATLPGGAVLDGTPGPERLYAVCSDPAVPIAAVESAARLAAGGGAEAVRRAPVLAGLPAGATQASLLLEKSP